ncbi:DUF6531 domain-containing protein [Kitasatospora sp. GP82]|uniref:DUF6531 domain-containing protein n=1 Tax=Kitasatospora sp. GP82 TaxID=3035089 RepID=UPI002475B9EE|nr:DUF6531 domain-containing protein [Kitasatospora sp. GP82]MDH6128125.1 RHS repeat-associated protein [Kitasatospora sp. GP82]
MTNQIVKALEHGAQKLGKTLGEDAGKAAKDLYSSAGNNLKKVAKNTAETDAKHADELKKILGGGKKDVPGVKHGDGGSSRGSGGGRGGRGGSGSGPGGGRGGGNGGGRGGGNGSGGGRGGGSGSGGGRGGGSGRGGRGGGRGGQGSGSRPLRNDARPPRETAKPISTRVTRSDPVDIASGEMLLAQTDVELGGALPLLLTRTHISSYRVGGWFGPSWASTLDQRVELDAEGALFAAEDGMVLHYPAPDPDEPVLALEGPRFQLERDPESGTALRITDPRAGVTRYFDLPPGAQPDASGTLYLPLVALTDRNGHRIEILYTDSGTPVEVRHSGGYRIAVDTADSRITGFRLLGAGPEYGPDADALPLVGFGYDGNGNLAEVVNSSGQPGRFTYDGQARITSWTDRNQRRYRYLYDRAGRCVQTRGDGGFLDAVFAYNTEQRTTTVRDSLGNSTVYQLNELGQSVMETDPLGHTVHRAWDRYDRPLSRTDTLGRTVSFEFDIDGNPAAVTRPDGSRTTIVHNELYLPVHHVGPDGATWSYAYDDCGNPTEVGDPTGAVTRYGYDEQGHLATVTDGSGGTTLVRCDAAGLPVQVSDSLGGTRTTVRDAFGRPVEVVDAVGGLTRTTWTPEGLPLSRTGPDGAVERWEWDGEGNLLRHTDALGAVTVHTYTYFDLPASRTDPDGSRYTFEYDTELRLTRVTNPQGLHWDYTYDALGNPLSETDFDGRTLRYEYDAGGQLTARVGALGQRTTFSRDVLGRILSKDVDGTVTRYTFDSTGRLRSADSPTSVLERGFGPDGTAVETVDGRTLTVRYDAQGRRTARRTPAGVESSWTYDGEGNPADLGFAGKHLSFTWDAAGRETSRRWGSEVSLRQTWDGANRLTSQLLELDAADGSAPGAGAPGGRIVQRRGYTYRSGGGLCGIDDHLAGPRAFTLDAVGRVTAVTARGWTESYAYDASGNLADARWPASPANSGAVGPRSYSGTELTRAGSVHYTYDGAGRVTTRQKTGGASGSERWTYTWDAEDRLVAVTAPDGQLWRYSYDPLGRRTAKLRIAEDGTTVLERTDFTWDGPNLCEQTTHAPHLPGPHTLTWEHDGHYPLAQAETIVTGADASRNETSRRFFAIVTDLVGTPTELVDTSGGIAWRARTTLWGATTWPSGSSTYTPLRFPGQYFDPETRLHYNVNRYYDPETARYTSPDPLGLEPSPNPANYVVNPHTWLDPLGLAMCEMDVVRVYRKEKWDFRGAPGKSYRVEVDKHGNVTIPQPPNTSLYVNMSGDRHHTDHYQNGPEHGPSGGRVQSFEVPLSYVEKVHSEALPQNPNHFKGDLGGESWKDYKKRFPEISDPTQGPHLYGIPGSRLSELESHIIPGSGLSEPFSQHGWTAMKDGNPLTWEQQKTEWDSERGHTP